MRAPTGSEVSIPPREYTRLLVPQHVSAFDRDWGAAHGEVQIERTVYGAAISITWHVTLHRSSRCSHLGIMSNLLARGAQRQGRTCDAPVGGAFV